MKSRDLAYVALFAAITAVLGLLPAVYPLGSAVPITAQTLGVMLAGSVLGARRGGLALLVWSAGSTALLVGTGLARGWDRAAELATVVTALAVAVLGVPVLLSALSMRALAARPDPAPARPAACAGCACGAGGCGAAALS